MLGKLLDAGRNLFGSKPRNENPYPNVFTNKILSYAEQLDWNLEVVSEGRIRMLFEEEDGRSQIVYIFRQESARKQEVVCVSSPAALVSEIDKQGVDKKELYNELLTDNEKSINYAWALTEIEDDLLITANVDLLLDTMDLDELAAAVSITSTVADKLEQRFGGDNF